MRNPPACNILLIIWMLYEPTHVVRVDVVNYHEFATPQKCVSTSKRQIFYCSPFHESASCNLCCIFIHCHEVVYLNEGDYIAYIINLEPFPDRNSPHWVCFFACITSTSSFAYDLQSTKISFPFSPFFFNRLEFIHKNPLEDIPKDYLGNTRKIR